MSPAAVNSPAHPQNPKPSSDDPPSFNFNAPNVPSRSARSRPPRLVKHRKHQSRSTATTTTEQGPDLNPFRSSAASNRFSFSSEGFVFGTTKLESVSSRECDENLSTENGESDIKVGSGVGFVFGSSRVDSKSCLDSSRGNVENEVGRETRAHWFEFGRSSNKVHEEEASFEFQSFSDSKLPNSQGIGVHKSCSNNLNDELSSDFSSKCKLVVDACEAADADTNKNTDHFVFGSESTTAQFTFQTGLGESVDARQLPDCQTNKLDTAADRCSFSSVGLGVQTDGCASEAPFDGGVRSKDESNFTSFPGGFGVSFEDLNIPLQFSFCLKENLFGEINKSNMNVKGRSVMDKRSRKTRAKGKKPSSTKQWIGQDNTSKQNPVSPGYGSPMDFSPYGDPQRGESSAMFEESIHLCSTKMSSVSDATVTSAPSFSDATVTMGHNGDEGVSAAQGDHIYGKAADENFGHHGERISVHCSTDDSYSGAETTCFSIKNDHANCISRDDKNLHAVGADIGVTVKNQEQDCGTPCVASGFENVEWKPFTFVTSSSAERSTIVGRRQLRRVKNKKTVGCNAFVITPTPKVEMRADQSAPHSNTSFCSDVVETSEPHEQGTKVHIPSTDALHETCEKWRIRGNKAYRNRDFTKAEDLYTQGIVYVPSSERVGSCLKPLVLCYSNRAATRMCMGKIREALGDCMTATALDPNFQKVQMKAANFHLLLGEVENAQEYFNKCLQSRPGVCLDRRIVIDCADGIQKAQKVAEYMNRSAKLLEQKTSDAALSAVEIISEALSISEYSEKLLEMKAEALCLLRRYEEAIQLCEHSMYFAEKNFSSLNSAVYMDGARCEDHPYARLWRWCFISKSYFHLGRFEAALNLLEKLEQVGSIKDRYASKNLESSISLAVTVRELLSHKDAGNEAFRSGKYSEAVEHYTVTLSRSIRSRPFSAICLCNRAAAHQALGQITDAIADCSLAIALDGNYAKAVSRRATLHESIRDYGQAASDLQRLTSVLENQSVDKAIEPNSQGSSTSRTQELRNAYRRMPLMEEEAKKGMSLDFYLILGVKPSDSSADIKKAYRKAALKHHPDKSGQFLARSESGDEGQLWKEISHEVSKDADRLFKMIGEAYAVLSDTSKRSEYDFEEERRNSAMENKDNGIYRKSSDVQSPRCSSNRKHDFYSSPFDRGSYYRNSRESWKTYGDSFSRW